MDARVKEILRREAERRGYTFERTEVDGQIEERMIRPDGTVAVIARKHKSDKGKAAAGDTE